MGLEQHHRGDHPGWHGGLAEAAGAVEVGEVAGREQHVAVVGQEPVDALQAPPEQLGRAFEARLRGERA
jgi:hypothetical protein